LTAAQYGDPTIGQMQICDCCEVQLFSMQYNITVHHIRIKPTPSVSNTTYILSRYKNSYVSSKINNCHQDVQ